MKDKFKLLDKKNVYENNWITLQLHDIMYNFQKIEDYCVIKFKRDSVVVIVEKDGDVLITRNYRFVVDELSIEFPCGEIEANETYFEAAKREVFEETNIEIDNLEYIGYFYPSNGIVTQKIHVIYSTYIAGEIIVENNELCDVSWISLSDLKVDISSITDASTLVSLLYLSNLNK